MMNHRMIARTLTCIAVLLALSGCILVKDFSAQWDKAKPDSCINKIAEALYYSEYRRDPQGKDMAELAHSFTLGKYNFLMLKRDVADKGGRMYRFGVINGIFQRYRLDPVMRATFEKDYPNAPVSLAHDTVEVADLGPEVMKLLGDISEKPEYWEIEDQSLYNVLRNPLCIFEDRDLKDKPKANK